MKNMRAFAVLTIASLMTACGEGLPETAELMGSEQLEPRQEQGAPQDESSEQDLQTLTDTGFVVPQETKSFASLWFARTPVRIHNTSDIPVQVHVWCSRYNFSRAPILQPGAFWGVLATCEGTTIYVYNGAPLSSGALLNVSVDN